MGPVICNHVGAITVNDGRRQKTNKLPAKNYQDSTEEYSVPVSFYSIGLFDLTYAASPAVSYRQSRKLPSENIKNKGRSRQHFLWPFRQHQSSKRLHRRQNKRYFDFVWNH